MHPLPKDLYITTDLSLFLIYSCLNLKQTNRKKSVRCTVRVSSIIKNCYLQQMDHSWYRWSPILDDMRWWHALPQRLHHFENLVLSSTAVHMLFNQKFSYLWFPILADIHRWGLRYDSVPFKTTAPFPWYLYCFDSFIYLHYLHHFLYFLLILA